MVRRSQDIARVLIEQLETFYLLENFPSLDKRSLALIRLSKEGVSSARTHLEREEEAPLTP